eukprot:GHVQ01014135.1.p1 GENE.GHVQ01014135.1~~GHVQ01014135.1.p1  ORF type:complete len:297 (+),score=33.01 GHVQ01014135.1:916-1806(+)
MRGNVEAADTLIQAGGNLFQADQTGCCPALVAVLHRQTKLLSHWLGGLIPDLNQLPRTNAGETALHLAARENHHEPTTILLTNGADPNCQSPYGFTPLHVASERGYLNAMRALLASYESGKESCKTGDGSKSMLGQCKVDATDQQRQTPLHRAAHKGHCEACQLLIQHGATVDFADEVGDTPLSVALRSGSSHDCIGILVESGADLTTVDKSGWTIFQKAVMTGDAKTCSALFKYYGPIHKQKDYPPLTSLAEIAELFDHPHVMPAIEPLITSDADNSTEQQRNTSENASVDAQQP